MQNQSKCEITFDTQLNTALTIVVIMMMTMTENGNPSHNTSRTYDLPITSSDVLRLSKMFVS